MDLILVVVIILVMIALAVALVLRRQKKKRDLVADGLMKRADVPMSPFDIGSNGILHKLTPDQIKIGWHISHAEIGKQQVVGMVNYREGNYRWMELFLENLSGSRKWLSVEQEDDSSEWEYVLWTELGLSDFESTGKKTVQYDGKVFKLDDEGVASYTAVGLTNIGEGSGTVQYKDFLTDADPTLQFSIERYDGHGDEGSVGVVLDATFIRLEPEDVGFEG